MPMLLMRMKGPVLALAVALLLVFLWPTLAGWAGAAEGSLGAQVLRQVSEALVLIAGAWMVMHLLHVAVWTGIVLKRSGSPAPRLLTDLVNGLIAVTTGSLIIAFVLDKPVTGLIATSGIAVAALVRARPLRVDGDAREGSSPGVRYGRRWPCCAEGEGAAHCCCCCEGVTRHFGRVQRIQGPPIECKLLRTFSRTCPLQIKIQKHARTPLLLASQLGDLDRRPSLLSACSAPARPPSCAPPASAAAASRRGAR